MTRPRREAAAPTSATDAPPASEHAGARRATRGGRRWREGALPYLFVLPVLTLMGAFIYWPLLYSVYLSTLDWNFVSPTREFVGLANFAGLAQSPDFLGALSNTGVYLLVMVPVLVLLPLGLAVLLWPVRRSRAQGVYRAVLFAPTVTSLPVMAVVWLWILNPIQGVLNQAIAATGGGRINWLADPNTAPWCIMLVSAWKILGFNMILFVAALEAVPRDYLEAAELDGAGSWHLFRHVRLPLITPTLFFVVVATVIFVNEELFAAVNVITQGGPDGSTANLLYFLYERGFRFFDIGGASATALVVFALVATVTWLQFRYVEGRVHYG